MVRRLCCSSVISALGNLPLNRTAQRPKATCSIVSLGCPKNLIDSERMVGLLRLAGYELVREPSGADLVIVNTCGFLEIARQESLDVIRQMLHLKKQGRIRGVIVAGCLAQRDRLRLLERCPGIDRLIGVFARDEIVRAAEEVLAGQAADKGAFEPPANGPGIDFPRARLTLPHIAYLRIAEGCDRLCTFCAIPRIRGPYRSKPIQQVVDEAEQLAAEGVRELVLVAQDTSSYGIDLTGRPMLAELLERLEQVAGLAWIRLMYLYPMHWTDALLERLASSRKTLRYLDLPLQHINDAILRRMKRRVSRAETEGLLERLRQKIADLVLRTTLMVGFPGETEDQFDELVEFVRAQRFERLGVFAYSREPGTPAAKLPGQIPAAVAQRRRNRLMEVQQEIAFAWNRSQLGRRLDVLIDRCISDRPAAFVGRTYADAPEVDGVVYLTPASEQMEGRQNGGGTGGPASRYQGGSDEPFVARGCPQTGEGSASRYAGKVDEAALQPAWRSASAADRYQANEAALQPGQIVPCEIVAAQGYDLVAVAIGTPR